MPLPADDHDDVAYALSPQVRISVSKGLIAAYLSIFLGAVLFSCAILFQ